ncbi:hypothetical protein [Thioalkalivibrio sp. ALJT]|uniref:hypothetical protein n=1 Tax=Thioalkalivibrio sp. ALJT TaxID=1158146 RepID=UPI000369AF19|nr:hypothetical protein [Thioalkalivibrio sp. ALJT]
MSEFLSPQLVGERFRQHTIPLELLKDLAVLEELVVEIAKHCYREAHPGRQRIPRGFTDGISLHLRAIDTGSAIARIDLKTPDGELLPPAAVIFFEQARERLVQAIAAAGSGGSVEAHLPASLLGYFDRIGRGLREGEYVDFRPEHPELRSHLSQETRHELLWASGRVEAVSEEVALRGTIPEMDQQRRTFSLQIVNGPRVVAPLEEQHGDTVRAAFNRYEEGQRVLLQGIGRRKRDGKLQDIESVEHVSLLDPLDVPARLDEFRALRDGWLDGTEGRAPLESGLDWLARQFEWHYPDDLRLPWVFPTAEGGVQAEWKSGDQEITLDIDLSAQTGEWHLLDLNSGREVFDDIELSSSGGWAELARRLREVGGVDE